MSYRNLQRLHYTTTSGLLGMFKDNTDEQAKIKLWATHYLYMNDPEEFKLGTKLCTEIIDQIESELCIPMELRVKNFVESTPYIEALSDYRRTSVGQTICPYIISFSKAYDSLHMWDMYASHGNGLALVFNYQKLLEAKLLAADCFYCNPVCDNVISCLSNKYKDAILEIYKDVDEEFPIDVVKGSIEHGDYGSYYNRIHTIHTLVSGHIGIRIKNHSYSIEDEARIIVRKNDDTKLLFRDRKGVLLPYIESPIPFDCVEHILVGPTADFYRVRESILIFLDHKGVKNWNKNKIIQSMVPYRF